MTDQLEHIVVVTGDTIGPGGPLRADCIACPWTHTTPDGPDEGDLLHLTALCEAHTERNEAP